MKQNRLNKMQTRSDKVGIILVVILTLVLFSVPALFASEAGKASKESKKRATQVTNNRAEAVSEKLKEPDEKKPTELKTKITAPKGDQPAVEFKPVEVRETQVLSASAVGDKGRQIKWQIICSGGNCGASNPALCTGYHYQEGFLLCGSAGQVAVGPGSSPSFGMNSGFWQEFLKEEYIRGDVNRDGVINIGDVVYLISYLYRDGPAPDPLWTGDVNCDVVVALGDVVYLISYLYRGGPPPAC